MKLIDVRCEDEFEQGHIPQAINYPLLNNEERAQVGKCYKQKGNYKAVLLGYELVGHKFATYIQEICKLIDNTSVVIHCFRGGLRSRIMSQLLTNAGIQVYIIQGGYKAFRKWTVEVLKTRKRIYILGGYTGSGKTNLLSKLAAIGHQTVDIEKLANHRGSSFGHIEMGGQPTNELFENLLAVQWSKLNVQIPTWIEDESRVLGDVIIPESVFQQMRNASVFRLDIGREERLKNIVDLYGNFNKDELVAATQNLEKRLGGLRLNNALYALDQNDFYTWADILLSYYDDNYHFSSGKRDNLCVLELNQQEFDAYIANEFPKMMHKLYILLGGNQGEVLQHFEKAKAGIVSQIGSIHRASSVYETAAWGKTNQPHFLNQIVEVYTTKTPHKCMELLLGIEQQLGRIRHEKYDPRTIDLDIILFGNEVINDSQLQIPHPRMNERRFVLTPLNELIPQNIHPQSKQSIAALLKKCDDLLPVNKLNLSN